MKPLKILLLVILFLCYIANFTKAQSANWEWAKSPKARYESFASGVGNDAKGNVYITGSYDSSIIFGKDTFLGYGAFLAKYDSSGNVIWGKSLGAIGYNEARGLSIDAKGNAYVIGGFKDTIILGNNTFIHSGEISTIIAKYDSSGNGIWGATCNEQANNVNYGQSVSVDAKGNVYITGSFSSPSISFGNFALINYGSYSIYIAKYNSSGTLLWAKSPWENGFSLSTDISTDANGNVYVVGEFDSSIIFGSDTLINNSKVPNGVTPFLAKYDSSGNVVWAKSFGSDGGGNDIADTYGNVYITGSFTSPTIIFGKDTLINSSQMLNGANPFIAKYDSLGNVIWAKGGEGAGGNDGDYGITLDANGYIYIAGQFNDTITFGNDTLINSGNVTCFVAKYDSSGMLLWAKTNGGTGYGSPSGGISTDAKGNIYIAGSFDSTFVFGNDTLVDSASVYGAISNVFIAKIGGCTPPAPPTNTTTTSALTIYKGNITELTASGTGTFGWYNAATGGTYLGAGATFITPTLDSTTTFYVQDSTCGASTRMAITVTVNVNCTPPAPPTNTTTTSALTIYKGNITELTASGTGTFGWYSSAIGGTYLGAGATFITPTLDSTTTFYVQDSTCGASTRTAITVTTTYHTGIAAINETEIKVYPNPTDGNIYFSGVKNGYTLQVYNVLGEVIYTGTINADNYAINLTANAKGIYLFRIIENSTFIKQGKIVLE